MLYRLYLDFRKVIQEIYKASHAVTALLPLI